MVIGSDGRKGSLNVFGGTRAEVFFSTWNGTGVGAHLKSTGNVTLSGASMTSSSSSIRQQLVWQAAGTLSVGGGTVSVGCFNSNHFKSFQIKLTPSSWWQPASSWLTLFSFRWWVRNPGPGGRFFCTQQLTPGLKWSSTWNLGSILKQNSSHRNIWWDPAKFYTSTFARKRDPWWDLHRAWWPLGPCNSARKPDWCNPSHVATVHHIFLYPIEQIHSLLNNGCQFGQDCCQILALTSPPNRRTFNKECKWLSLVKYNLVLTCRPGLDTPCEYLSI